VAPLIALIASPVERGEVAQRLAFAIDLALPHVEAAVRAAGRGEDPRESVPMEPRRSGPEDRNLEQLARSLVHHPRLAGRIPHAELAALVPAGPVRETIEALASLAGEGRAVDLEKISERLGGEARSLLWRLAAGDESMQEAVAERTLVETLAWLRKRRRAEQKRAITRQMHDPNADSAALLGEKQRLLDEERLLAKH